MNKSRNLYNRICKEAYITNFDSTIQDGNYLKIFHWNIRSLAKNHNKLETLINFLDINFDIIVLSETWGLNSMYRHLFEGYTYISGVNTNFKSSGCAIFIRETIGHKLLNIRPIHGADVIGVDLHFSGRKSPFSIYIFYRHPSENVEMFCSDLSAFLNDVGKNHGVILGDFNINIMDTHSTKCAAYLDLLHDSKFFPLITKPTRHNPTGSTCIDHIFYNNINTDTVLSGSITTSSLDHMPQYALMKLGKTKPTNQSRPWIRNYSQDNVDNFSKLFSQLYSYDIPDATSCLEHFLEIMNLSFEQSFPLRQISISNFKSKPWFNNGVKEAVMRKNQTYRKYICNKTEHNKTLYLYWKKKAHDISETSKNVYFKLKLDRCYGNAKKTWQVLNGLMLRKNNPTTINYLLHEGVIYDDPEIICNIFNEYFSNITKDIYDSYQHKNFRPTNDSDLVYIDNSMFLSRVTPDEVIIAVNSCNNSGALGYGDMVNMKLIKRVNTAISSPLCHAINLAFDQQIFPHPLKNSLIKPIFKKGAKDDKANYRPIQILPVLSKIYEYIIKMRMVSFMERYDILNDSQYGFRKGGKATNAIIDLINYITTMKDNDKHSVAIFLDFQKAFDTIDHNLLYTKLQHMGFRGNILDILKSYTSQRKIYTSCNGYTSGWLYQSSGTPQGSILGPLLFILYINDMKFNLSCKLVSFADDTVLLVSSKNLDNLQAKVDKTMIDLQDWLHSNKMFLNISKTACMFFPTRKHLSHAGNHPTVKFHHSELQFCSNTNYLGLVIDDGFKFRLHIDCIIKKLRQFIPIFYNIRNKINNHSKISVYNAMIHSKLIYGITVYGHGLSTSLNGLQRLQNKLIKILFSLKSSLAVGEISGLNVLNLKQQTFFSSSYDVWCYKHLPHIHVAKDLRGHFTVDTCNTHHYKTRNRDNFCLSFNHPMYTNSLPFQMKIYWNYLPRNIRILENKIMFKKAIHNFSKTI